MTEELKTEIVKSVCHVATSAIAGFVVVRIFCGRPIKVIKGVSEDEFKNLVDTFNENVKTINLNVKTANANINLIEKKLKVLAEKDSKLAKRFEEIDNEC